MNELKCPKCGNKENLSFKLIDYKKILIYIDLCIIAFLIVTSGNFAKSYKLWDINLIIAGIMLIINVIGIIFLPTKIKVICPKCGHYDKI